MIIPLDSPKRRPILRFISAVTCFTFILTQAPFIRTASALPTHPTGAENIANLNSIANASNLVKFEQSIRNLQESIEQKRKYNVAMASLIAGARIIRGIESHVNEIAQGAQTIYQVSSGGTNVIDTLAGVAGGYNIAAPGDILSITTSANGIGGVGIVKPGAIEFNYSIQRQKDERFPVLKIYFKNGQVSRITNERINSPGGPFYRDTLFHQYHNGLPISYQAFEYRVIDDLPHDAFPGGVLPLRDITWTGKWSEDSKFYASKTTQAKKKLLEEAIDTITYTAYTPGDIRRIMDKIAEVTQNGDSPAWVKAMQQALAPGGGIRLGVVDERRDLVEKFYRAHDGQGRPTHWHEVRTDYSGMTEPAGVTDAQVTVDYIDDSEKKIRTYNEVGTHKAMFVSPSGYQRYADWSTQILDHPEAFPQEQVDAARHVREMMNPGGQLTPNQRYESTFTLVRTYGSNDYNDKEDPIHWKERRTSSTGPDTEIETTMTYDSEQRMVRQVDEIREKGSYSAADIDSYWDLVRRIKAKGVDATAADVQRAGDLRLKLDSGEISIETPFVRNQKVTRDGFVYNDSRLSVEWIQTAQVGGTETRERFLTYYNDGLGRNRELLVYTDEKTRLEDDVRQKLREQALAILRNPDSTEAGLKAAQETLAFLRSEQVPTVFSRSSIRYRGKIIYNASNLPIEYTEVTTSNADRIATQSHVQAIVYNPIGLELSSFSQIQRTGTGTRNAYFLSDGTTELTAQTAPMLRSLLAAYYSTGKQAAIQDLIDLGEIQAFDAQGNSITEQQIEGILRANPIVINQATTGKLVDQGILVKQPDGSYTDGDGNVRSQAEIDALIAQYTVTRPRTIDEAIQDGYLKLLDRSGNPLDESSVAVLLRRHSLEPHVPTLDELVTRGALKKVEGVSYTLDQASNVFRHGFAYDHLARVMEFTEETTNPSDGIKTTTHLYGITHDSQGRQTSSVQEVRRQGTGLRTTLFSEGEELSALDLQEQLPKAWLADWNGFELREVEAPIDLTVITYQQETNYYGFSTLAEGGRSIISTRGGPRDGVTATEETSLTRFNDKGQLLSQFVKTQQSGVDTISLPYIGDERLTIERMQALQQSFPDLTVKDMFDVGLLRMVKQPSIMNNGTQTYRSGMEYEKETGFLKKQMELTSSDQSPGSTTVDFLDASYSSTGQLLFSRTKNRSTLFDLEGSSDLMTFNALDPKGQLRYAEAVGTQSNSDLFGSGSDRLVRRYSVGVNGQSKLVADISMGLARELDGSAFQIGERTTYQYDAFGNVVHADGSSTRIGTDVWGNFSKRSQHTLYGVINGDPKAALTFSTDPSELGKPEPLGTGATFSLLKDQAKQQGITGSAPAPFLANPQDYDKVTVADLSLFQVYKFLQKSDGKLTGALIDIPGVQIPVLNVNDINVDAAGVITIDSGSGYNHAKYVVQTLSDGTVQTTRYSFKSENFTSKEVEAQVMITASSNGVTTTTDQSISFKDNNGDGDTDDPEDRVDATTRVVNAIGLISVTSQYTDGNVNGTVAISGIGYQASIFNVTNVTLNTDQITVEGTGVTFTINQGASGTTITKKVADNLDQTQNQSVTIQRLTRQDGDLTVSTLLTVVRNSQDQVTKATWVDEVSQTAWATLTARWDDHGTASDLADDTAAVIINGEQGYTTHYFGKVTDIGFAAGDPEQVAFVDHASDGTDHTYRIQRGNSALTVQDTTASTQTETSRIGGTITTLYRNADGTVAQTIRVEEGTYLTKIRTYQGDYQADAPDQNVVIGEDVIGQGFTRTDLHIDSDGNLVWADANGDVVRSNTNPGSDYHLLTTQRTIFYLTDSNIPSQIARITYDANDSAVASPTGDIRDVYMEQYNDSGAAVKVMQVARQGGEIQWARQQKYDQSGSRQIFNLVMKTHEDGSQYRDLVGIFTDASGARTRIFAIPDNTVMDGSFPKRAILEIANSEQVAPLRIYVESGDPATLAADLSTLTEDQWDGLLGGPIDLTVNGQTYTVRLPQVGDADDHLATLSVPAPTPVRGTLQIVSYTGSTSPPDISMLDLMRLAWAKRISVPGDGDGDGVVAAGETTTDPKKVLEYIRQGGKEITIPWDTNGDGQIGSDETVTVQQAGLDLSVLLTDQRDALLNGQAISLSQRQIISFVNYTGSGAPPTLDQIQLSEADRNNLMLGQDVTVAVNGDSATIRRFKPDTASKFVTISKWVNADGTAGTGTPPSLDGISLDDQQWADLQKFGGEITVTLADGTQVTLKSQGGLAEDQNSRLGVGDTTLVRGLVATNFDSDGKATSGVVQEQTLSNIQMQATYSQGIINYFGNPADLKLEFIQNADGTTTRRYLYAADDPARQMTIDINPDQFLEAYRPQMEGTLRITHTLDYGWMPAVTGWDEMNGDQVVQHHDGATELPPALNTVRLTEQQRLDLEAGSSVVLTTPDKKYQITIQKSAVDPASLTDQQVKDLKAGRFLWVGSDLLGLLTVSSGIYYLTSKTTEIYQVEENAAGILTVRKKDAQGAWTEDVTGSFDQKEMKSFRDAVSQITKKPTEGSSDKSQASSAPVGLSQPIAVDPMQDESDTDLDGNRTETARMARVISVAVTGGTDFPQISGFDLSDSMSLVGLLDSWGKGDFKDYNGFGYRFEHAPDLPPIVGVIGAKVLMGSVRLPKPPAVVGASAGSNDWSGTNVTYTEITGSTPPNDTGGSNPLAEQVYAKIDQTLRDLMSTLGGAAAGALGILSDVRIVDLINRLRNAFGGFIINCGAIALSAFLQARGYLADAADQVTAAARLMVRQLVDFGEKMIVQSLVGPAISAYTIRMVADEMAGESMQTIQVGPNSEGLYLRILSASAMAAIIHFADHWVTFLGLVQGTDGTTLVRYIDSDNQEHDLDLVDFLSRWRVGGGFALVTKTNLSSGSGSTPGPPGLPPTPSGPSTGQTPLSVRPIEGTKEHLIFAPPIDPHQLLTGAQPIPLLTAKNIDRIDLDGTASHTDNYLQYDYNEEGKLVGGVGSSTTYGETVFGEKFSSSTQDTYITIQGQLKVAQSVTTRTSSRLDGTVVVDTGETNFEYTNNRPGDREALMASAFYRNPDGTIQDRFLLPNGRVRRGLVRSVTGTASSTWVTAFGETGDSTTAQNYDITAAGARVTLSDTQSSTHGIDGTETTSTQVRQFTFDPATGVLVSASGFTRSHSTDPFGAVTDTWTTPTYLILNNQAQEVEAFTRSNTVTLAGDVIDEVSNDEILVTTGTEDPATLPAEYSNPLLDGTRPPTGRVWAGLQYGRRQQLLTAAQIETLAQVGCDVSAATLTAIMGIGLVYPRTGLLLHPGSLSVTRSWDGSSTYATSWRQYQVVMGNTANLLRQTTFTMGLDGAQNFHGSVGTFVNEFNDPILKARITGRRDTLATTAQLEILEEAGLTIGPLVGTVLGSGVAGAAGNLLLAGIFGAGFQWDGSSDYSVTTNKYLTTVVANQVITPETQTVGGGFRA
ncbi:MAG: hypothetical protein HY211_05940, partial [Candidatus Omnitrophica bacterium]|nr:hypothetical protein [Candidatus Omnitrophota bacterium]